MSNFISLFKKMFFKNAKNYDEITNKSVHNEMITLVENNMTDKIDNNDIMSQDRLDNDIILIVNALMSQSLDENEEMSKEKILKQLIDGKGIKVQKLAKKYKESVDKEICYYRKKIINVIKSKPNINSINNEEDQIFNDNSFYNYLSQGKDFIANFLSKYRIEKRFILNSKLFEDILENYQSFNLKCLSYLSNYLENFDCFYKVYMNFATIINSVNKINNIIKNMKNGEIDSKYIDNIYHGLEEGAFNLSSLFSKFDKKIEKIQDTVKKNSEEIEKLKADNERLKADNERLKADNEKLKADNEKLKADNEKLKIDNEAIKTDNNALYDRVEALEKGLKNIGIELECPISCKIIESPVITPYGFTYEEKEIKKWIHKQGNDPMNQQPLAENHLIKNYGLKKVIDQYNIAIYKNKNKNK